MLFIFSEQEDSGCGNDKNIQNKHDGNMTSHPGFGVTSIPHRKCEWIFYPPKGKYVAITVTNLTDLICRVSLGKEMWAMCFNVGAP